MKSKRWETSPTMPSSVACRSRTRTNNSRLKPPCLDHIDRFDGHIIRPCVRVSVPPWVRVLTNRYPALTKLEPDWYLEVEKNYALRIAQRKEIFAKNGKLVLNYLPGSELGCKEIMEMCLQFLCARYPQYFTLSHSTQTGHVFHNGILKNETIINRMHPLHVLLENVPEDFAVMVRNPDDGCYYFRAGVICSALGWNVDTKLGMQLKEIHGPIPDYKEKMEFSMDRYVTPYLLFSINVPSHAFDTPERPTQVLFQTSDVSTHSAWLLGLGSRHTALHATQRPA